MLLSHWGDHMWSQVYLTSWGWVDVELLEGDVPQIGDYSNCHVIYGLEETKYYGTVLGSTCLTSYLSLEYAEIEYEPLGGE